MLMRLEDNDDLFRVIKDRFNAVVEAVEALQNLSGDNELIRVSNYGQGFIVEWLGPQSFPVGASGGGSGGSVEIGVMTVRPNGGYGPAAYRKIRINQDGTWTAIGADIPIVIPKL